MANCIIVGGGSGGALSSDVTASKANVLVGTKTVTSDSNNAVVDGTMVNRGTVNHSLPINGSFTIQQGYHSGSGKVSQSVTTKGAATYYPSTSDQTIAANQYLIGAQTINAISQQNLIASNIKKGVTVYIKNGNGNLYAVTGTWEGYVASTDDLYNHGQYGPYGTLVFATSTDAIVMDSGQITFRSAPDGAYQSTYIYFALITPVAINMARYTKMTIEGSTWLGSAGADRYTTTVTLYADLLNSIPSNANRYEPNLSEKFITLGTKSQSGHTFTWTNPTISWSRQNVTKYLRILWRQDATGAFSYATGSWVKITLS